VEADAMSTALFVLGMEASKAVLEDVPTCHALFVPDEQPVNIWVSKGFLEFFTPDTKYAGTVKTLDGFNKGR
jgi:thiamine biosynthesis lipoprotein ApbE